MALLVTGGAGYIGSVATELLLSAGERVVVLDNLSRGHRGAVAPEATFIEGDIRDRALLDSLFNQHEIDTIMHFAAFALVGESVEKPALYFENNVNGSHRLLNAAVDAGVKRFIFSSTCATYGFPDRVPLTEDLPTRPINPYGLSKRMVEEILEWYATAYDFQYVALRYFNACGATESHGEDHAPETHLIPNIFRAITGEGGPLQVFGDDYNTPDGTCIRDYVHVTDLIDAHIRSVNYLREGGASDYFNLGTETGNSVLEVIRAVERVTGVTVPYTIAPRRAGDADRLVASSAKAREVLRWQPAKRDIELVVSDAWRWHQAHPRGYGA
ncbi:MAG TPA: UDP-glucose 4-epimerase GalE [Candidatus Hydrogenedentes bacterium]|jgi:UDP-glucose 4-epimerase|nr:UDP-glucose 4-epimerase GalE [Candidatus Hydrogenedentota bacterium]